MNGSNASIWLIGAILYLLPTFIAWYRHANSIRAIAICNILFGWTLVMWFGASVWAITDKSRSLPQSHRHPLGNTTLASIQRTRNSERK